MTKIDFRKMPEYTRPDQFRIREYARERGNPAESHSQEFDDEYERELSDLYDLDGWGG